MGKFDLNTDTYGRGNIESGKKKLRIQKYPDSCRRTGPKGLGLFLESPDDFSGPESCFVFSVFVFKIKVSIILKIIQ